MTGAGRDRSRPASGRSLSMIAAACVLITAAHGHRLFAADVPENAGNVVFLDVGKYINKGPDEARDQIRRDFGTAVRSVEVDRRLSILYFATNSRMYVEMPYLSGKIISVNIKLPVYLSDYKEVLRAVGYTGNIPPPSRVTPTIVRWENGALSGYDEVSLWKSASAQDRIIGIHFIKDKTQYNVWKTTE
jgi:hypothetical protein